MKPVRVPDSLQNVRIEVLEVLPPGTITEEALQQAAQYAIERLPLPENGLTPLENKTLQLVFRHDCMALGCLDPQCALCQHNPNRRCIVNFDRKYLVNDILKAKCGSLIRVELIDAQTGALVEDDIPDLKLEMYVLDGNLYDTKFLESAKDGGPDMEDDLESYMLLLNKKKNAPLLVCGAGGCNDAIGKVYMPIMNGKAGLPDLHITDSSEAILSGRKPPFRLLVRAILPDSRPGLKIRHAISEGFVVATRRTRTAGKVDIPSIEDHVSKLEHMGKETVKKLQDIRLAASQAGIDIDIPENCILRVGDFKMLSMRAEQDGHLRQRLQHVLKLSKEKWEEARDHAMRAVAGDGRMRAWYADRRTLEVGLLFATRLGCVDLDRPVALLQHHAVNDGGPDESKVEATLMAQQTPAQRDLVRQLQPQAAHSWWLNGHPGWAIFPMDTEQFLQGNMPETSYEVSPDPSRNNSEAGYAMQQRMQAPGSMNPSSQLIPPSHQGGPVRNQMSPFVQQHPGMGMGSPAPGLAGNNMPPPLNMPGQYGAGHMGGSGNLNQSGGHPQAPNPGPSNTPPSRTPNPFAQVATSNVQGSTGNMMQQQLLNSLNQQLQQAQQQQGQPNAGVQQQQAGGYAAPTPSGPSSISAHEVDDENQQANSKRGAEEMGSASSPRPDAYRRNMMMPPPPPKPQGTSNLGYSAQADPGEVNPFMSFHHAAEAGGLKESGGTLDLGALPSLPMDPSMFGGGAAGRGTAGGGSAAAATALANVMQASLKGGPPMGSLGTALGLMSEDLEGHFPASFLENMETSIQNGGSIDANLLQQLLAHTQQTQGLGNSLQGQGLGPPQQGGQPSYPSLGGQPLFTVTSGLDTMQSIEQALDAIQR